METRSAAPEWRLYVGNKFTGIVVRPDDKWPSMWRVHWPDRSPSDMVNLARAKDAALARVRLGGEEVPRWRRRETASGRATAA